MDASYPISVRQVAALLHTSFRRHLAMTPLCFASPSPPSGWTGDFHPQTIEHAGHTTKPLRGRRPRIEKDNRIELLRVVAQCPFYPLATDERTCRKVRVGHKRSSFHVTQLVHKSH